MKNNNKLQENNKINFKNILSRKDTIGLSVLTFLYSIIFYFGIFNNLESPFGVSIFLLEILFLIINFNFFGKNIKLKKNYNIIISTILALLVSFWYSIFTNEFFNIAFLFVLTLLNFFIVFNTLNKKFEIFGNIQNYISNFFDILGKFFDLPFFGIKELKKAYFGEKGIINNKENIKNFTIGFGILVGILFIILPLLASADKVFSKFLDDFISIFLNNEFLNHLNTGFFGDLFFIGIIFLLSFAVFLYIPTHKVEIIEEKKKEYKNINKIINSVIIYGLNIVYFLFILVQFRYIFFGNQELFKSLDITYASYIHQGFYQLMVVSAINFLLYKFFSKRISNKNNSEKIKLLLLLIFTIIISYSALTRIFLYIEAYSLTILRFFVVYICILIIILFLVNIYTLYSKNKKINNYFYYLVLISFIFVGYLNIESYVANYNINHYKNSLSKDLDKDYIEKLGDDAINEKKLIFPEKNFQREITQTKLESILNYNYYFNKNTIIDNLKKEEKVELEINK